MNFPFRVLNRSVNEFVSLTTCLDDLSQKKLVFFGEIHSRPKVVAFQYEVQKAMVQEIVRKRHKLQQERFETSYQSKVSLMLSDPEIASTSSPLASSSPSTSSFGTMTNSSSTSSAYSSTPSSSIRENSSNPERLRLDSETLTEAERLRLESTSVPTLHIVLEHFSFPMQVLLDRFAAHDISFDELQEEYTRLGNEGHDLTPYREILELSRTPHHWQPLVVFHAGFLPREWVQKFLKLPPEARGLIASHVQKAHQERLENMGRIQSVECRELLYEEKERQDGIPWPDPVNHAPPNSTGNNSNPSEADDRGISTLSTEEAQSKRKVKRNKSGIMIFDKEALLKDENRKGTLFGSKDHFASFKAMITDAAGESEHVLGRNSSKLKLLFQAQLLKDYAMADFINNLMQQHQNGMFLIVAGRGHLEHSYGVVERVCGVKSSDFALVVTIDATEEEGVRQAMSQVVNNQQDTRDNEQRGDKVGPEKTKENDWRVKRQDTRQRSLHELIEEKLRNELISFCDSKRKGSDHGRDIGDYVYVFSGTESLLP